MSSIKILNDAHWHSLRAKYVGASESAALFGMLPWKSKWNLHMEKSGKLPAPDLEDVKHIQQGKFFEPAIAGWAAKKWGITLNKVHVYDVADDCPGMGASRDYVQIGTGQRIDTEIKWVVRNDGSWEYEGDLIVRSPEHYLIQTQHQMGCSGNQLSQVIAFIDGDIRRGIYERRPAMIGSIKAAVKEFWTGVREDIEPPIDFKADAEAVMKYAAMMPVRSIDWTPELSKLAKRQMWMARFSARAEEASKAAKAELAHMMLEAAKRAGANDEDGKVVTEGDGYKISSTLVDAYPGKEVTEEMVGTRIGARGSYRLVSINRPKPKKGKKEKDNA